MCSLGMIRNSCFVQRMLEFYEIVIAAERQKWNKYQLSLMITFCNRNIQCITSLRLFVMCFIFVSCVVLYCIVLCFMCCVTIFDMFCCVLMCFCCVLVCCFGVLCSDVLRCVLRWGLRFRRADSLFKQPYRITNCTRKHFLICMSRRAQSGRRTSFVIACGPPNHI
jgi:hypothetical protein